MIYNNKRIRPVEFLFTAIQVYSRTHFGPCLSFEGLGLSISRLKLILLGRNTPFLQAFFRVVLNHIEAYFKALNVVIEKTWNIRSGERFSHTSYDSTGICRSFLFQEFTHTKTMPPVPNNKVVDNKEICPKFPVGRNKISQQRRKIIYSSPSTLSTLESGINWIKKRNGYKLIKKPSQALFEQKSKPETTTEKKFKNWTEWKGRGNIDLKQRHAEPCHKI
ncbi:unnamed protein product [Lepeophtheirus salmonis]|uniref:(salmon louse) hypothetical protein n=1 Tax=Lepeophtheirus salmonis TaxID=72036 RepID=A0A7R8H0Q1_LEPSM|nr:unnamed protein product [Lepeophtheirus salmonis]CAF2793862.1 unnamed protein product [Lepeophtheirus salmonis]